MRDLWTDAHASAGARADAAAVTFTDRVARKSDGGAHLTSTNAAVARAAARAWR